MDCGKAVVTQVTRTGVACGFKVMVSEETNKIREDAVSFT